MRGADADDACLAGDRIDDDPLFIDRDGNQTRSCGHECDAHGRIARIFDGNDRFTGCHQRAGDQVECLLCARRDEHVVAAARNRAGQRNMFSDALPKLVISRVALRALER